MKVIGSANRWLMCARPGGCGWYWQLRTVKNYWWSRRRDEVKGAFWEDPGRPDLSSRPRLGLQWQRREDWEDFNADCMRHIKEVDNLTAQFNSSMRIREPR